MNSALLKGAESSGTTMAQAAQAFAAAAEQKGAKKIAVLPFSDLRNKRTAIGNYLSDMLAVELTKTKKTFNVHLLDAAGTNNFATGEQLRANLSKVGIDAYVTAIAVPMNETVDCSLKLISVQSAEVLSATIVRFSRNAEINQVLEMEGYMDWNQTFAELLRIRKGSEALGGLLMNVEAMKYTQHSQNDVKLRLTVTFVNTNKSEALSFGFKATGDTFSQTKSHILSSRKDYFEPETTSGLGIIYYRSGGYDGRYIDLAPLTSSNATLVYNLSKRIGDAPGDFPPYRFQAEIYIGKRTQEGVSNVKLYNFVFDIPGTN